MSTNPREVDPTSRAWVEVSAAALRRNLARVRASVGPDVGLVPMVKADAYGIGMRRAVDALEPERPMAYGVAAVAEGLLLRAWGVERPVIVFSPAPPGAVDAAVEADLTLTVSHPRLLDALSAAAERTGRAASFQVEVDTGMGRAGFDWRCAREWGGDVRRAAEKLRWTGCYTHLHSADVAAEPVHEQWARFQDAVAVLAPLPGDGFVLHCLNSAGALRCPEYAAGAVRPGIFLYGGRVGDDLPEPEAVAAVRARVVHVREAPAGTTAGYGATYRSGRDERWATLAIGYGDGFPRALGNRGSALLRGRRVPMVGRISMDVTVVDISDVPGVEVGDVATLIGSDGDERITVDDVAQLAGTISYEVLTGLGPRLPRVWTDVRGS